MKEEISKKKSWFKRTTGFTLLPLPFFLFLSNHSFFFYFHPGQNFRFPLPIHTPQFYHLYIQSLVCLCFYYHHYNPLTTHPPRIWIYKFTIILSHLLKKKHKPNFFSSGADLNLDPPSKHIYIRLNK